MIYPWRVGVVQMPQGLQVTLCQCPEQSPRLSGLLHRPFGARVREYSHYTRVFGAGKFVYCGEVYQRTGEGDLPPSPLREASGNGSTVVCRRLHFF